jgi:3-deoxy-D-arabino-heptulosonate 7-phosphate (DAHP) synthase
MLVCQFARELNELPLAVDVSKGEGSRSARGELRRSCAAGSVRGMSGYVIRDPGNQLSELMESGIR